MALNIDRAVAEMRRMTVNQLWQKFTEVCGEEPRSRNKQWLVKRLAWKLQAREYGGLSELALRRAAEIADKCDLSDLRLTAPKTASTAVCSATNENAPVALDSRLPKLGSLLTRQYKDRTILVEVLRDGFQFEGERYKSLSAVAKAVTGTHWNGYHFFKLNKKLVEA